MDNLSKDMIKCKEAGFGCHYGAWKATQEPVKIENPGIPKGFRVCAYCGMPFKPTTKRKQTYCGAACQRQGYIEKAKKAKEGADNGEA